MAKAAIKGEKPKNLGRKGGARFPNFSLKQILPNLKELISKTHGGKTLTIQQLNAGVFKVKAESQDGKIKYSSVKQFGLADGEYTSISAKDLASKIELTSDDEKITFIRDAFFNVKLFKNTFDTYHGDTTPKSKIKAYSVSTLDVHPDLADNFLRSLIESAEAAKLCTVNGDDVTFINAKDVNTKAQKAEESDGDEDLDEDFGDTDDEDGDDGYVSQEEPISSGTTKKNRTKRDLSGIGIQIDSHTRHDELEKQLKVLKKYGLI